MTAVAGAATASFAYDAFGRRRSATVAGSATSFLYDGGNVSQELTGTSVKATLLGGLRLDEVFRRTDAAGARTFLTDGLGSALALADDTGVARTQYTYTPYGATTATGDASSNPFQYTGRENDGTGLSYYRARYYSPNLSRFISEDPIGLEGGPNPYAYVLGDPLIYTDPLGECPWCVAGVIGGLTDLGIQLAFNGFNLKCVNWWEVGISAATSAAGVGLAQKLGKVSTVFGGPSRPTYRFLRIKDVVRVESHPISSSAPNWLSYPHWHPDFAGQPWSKMHWPLVEPLVGGPAAAYNATKGDCDCQ